MERTKFDFREEASWRIFRVMAEFIEGSQFLADLKREVTFFGSGRLAEDSPYYQEAYKLGKMLGQAGYTVITGGGPGIMEAANRGAYEAGAESVGLNIQLPYEQRTNPYVKKGIGFHYFFTRKFMLSASAQAYVFFPGGFGTVDEMTELVTLQQTKKMEKVPIILIGKKFWQPFLDWIAKTVYGEIEAIDKEDLKIYTLINTAEEAFKIIQKTKERKYF